MKIADGVNLYGLHPKMQIANCILAVLFYRNGVYPMLITSANDKTHSDGSLHYKSRACDYRIWGIIEGRRVQFAQACRDELGSEYDVVLKPDHLHIEYDPSNPKVI
jgi:hypothetical protein